MNALVPLPVALPLLVAALLTAGTRRIPRRVIDLLSAATALACAGLSLLLTKNSLSGPLLHWAGGWEAPGGIPLGIVLVAQPIGTITAALASTLVLASVLFSWKYFEDVGGLFHALLLVCLAGMNGFCLSGDLFNLFVFFELMSVPAYALTGFENEHAGPIQAALNFALVQSVAAILLLFGIALLYGRTGTLSLAGMGASLSSASPDALLLVALLLMGVAFLVKAAIVPFHFWLPDAHSVAPSPVSVLFSGVMVNMGLYGLARIYSAVFRPVFQAHEPLLRTGLFVLALLTALFGAVLCLLQRDLKRLLAFSTISHMGIMLAGLASFTSAGLAGAFFYGVGHGLLKGALFLCAGVLMSRFRTVELAKLRCRGDLPLGIVFWTGAVLLAGLPGAAAYEGKALIEGASASVELGWVTWPLIASTVLSSGAIFAAALGIFSKGPSLELLPEEACAPSEVRSRPALLVPPVLLIVLALAADWMPGARSLWQTVAAQFADPETLSARVLRGEVRVSPTGLLPERLSTLLLAFLTVALSLVLAGAMRERARFPPAMRRGAARFAPMISMVRESQSGDTGDYLVWLTIGTAVLGAGLFYALG